MRHFPQTPAKLILLQGLAVLHGVNFINVLTRSFYATWSQKRKKLLDVSVFFALLGSAHVKAACKMMVKWTTGSIFFSTAPFLNNKLFIWPNYKYSYNNTDKTFALPFSPFLFLSFYSSISLRSWLYEIQSEKTAKLIYDVFYQLKCCI